MTSLSPRLVTLVGLLFALLVSVHIQPHNAFVSRPGQRLVNQWSRSVNGGSLSSGRRVQGTVLQMGLLDGLKKIVGAQDPVEAMLQDNEKTLKSYQANVDAINKLEDEFEKLSNEQLRGKTEEFRKRLRSGASLDSVLVEAFAVAREASWRVLEMRHFDVQLLGGMALHSGRLAEMATGEGKQDTPTHTYALMHTHADAHFL